MDACEFCIEHKVLNNEKDLTSLNKEKAKKIFSSQLGKFWENADILSKSTKALFAVFAAHGCGDKNNALEILNKIGLSTRNNQEPNFVLADKIFEQFKNDPRVKEIYSRHAYINTVMAGMLEFARVSGVFPSAFFLWFKPRNRVLFNTLDGVGRQISFVEVAGISSHWRAERDSKLSIIEPVVDGVVEGLERKLLKMNLS